MEGVDLVVSITVSWIPLVADYTRFSRGRASAFWGTAVGYLVASAWLWLLGAVLFFSRDVTDPAALPAGTRSHTHMPGSRLAGSVSGARAYARCRGQMCRRDADGPAQRSDSP